MQPHLVLTYLTLIAAQLVFSVQIPINVQQAQQYADVEWNSASRLNVNSTNHLIFNTVSSLLQHWPNTRYRNGHTIVPASVPPGTLLYHGIYLSTAVPQAPSKPDWVAVDPEHSYMFCRGFDGKGCWHLTLVTTRTLKLLYFDGSSAAKHDSGPLDPQDLLLWGNIQRERQKELETDFHRITDLCNLGKETGQQFDGFVRMEMDFEIMLCNFTSGVEPVSFVNLATTLDHFPRDSPSNQSHLALSKDYDASIFFACLESGSRHDRFPGDTRIQLDLAHLISFYDVTMFPSLVPLRQGKERWDHRLEGMSQEDIAVLRKEVKNYLDLESTLEGHSSTRSGIDWAALIQVVKDRYAERLDLLRYLLTERVSAEETVRNATAHAGRMLMPFIPFNVTAPSSGGIKVNPVANDSWSYPVYKHCATLHTVYLSKLTLTRSEKLILSSIEEVHNEICRVVVRIWGEGKIYHGELNGDKPRTIETDDAIELVHEWRESVHDLMAWLDWSEWVRCTPECGFEEMCALPTWPFFIAPSEDQGSLTDEKWARPQPGCIRRLPPFKSTIGVDFQSV